MSKIEARIFAAMQLFETLSRTDKDMTLGEFDTIVEEAAGCVLRCPCG